MAEVERWLTTTQYSAEPVFGSEKVAGAEMVLGVPLLKTSLNAQVEVSSVARERILVSMLDDQVTVIEL